MKRTVAITTAMLIGILSLAGCAATDVVLKYSPGSLAEIVEASPDLVLDNTANDGYYYLTADGETALKVSSDYSKTGDGDIVLKTPLQPFLDAGLDVSELGSDYKADEGMFYLVSDYGDGSGTKTSVTDSLFESVAYDRDVLSYHQDLDHYGIKLQGGKFEFAKDYTTNDKDIVFVISAEPLAEAGADVANIDGWIFKTMKDADGGDIDVLLKPYDIK